MPGPVLNPGPGRKFPDMFDVILSDAGIKVVLTGVRIPRMNAIMERWIQTCLLNSSTAP
jgi:transposase InsO family protein